jgi:signal transduction histidine kinase
VSLRPPTFRLQPANTAVGATLLLVAIFAGMVFWFRTDLREEIHRKIIERDAAVLYPIAVQQVADSEAGSERNPYGGLTTLLKSARQKGMLGIAVFDRDGSTIETVPATQLFVELPVDDYWRLRRTGPIARFHPEFPLDQYFAGVSGAQRHAPVLEVLLALPETDPAAIRGFVRYYIDARPLSRELAVIDARINRQTATTLAVGAVLIGFVVGGATYSLQRAQRVIAERNERLTRANFELTLAAKASAVGQITSHLIHGLQSSVAGLHAVMASREGAPSPEWQSAASYTERLQRMIQETVALLADASANASYELSGQELAAMVRDRNAPTALTRDVQLEVDDGFPQMIDSHRGTLLFLIANNLVQNALTATAAGRRVRVALGHPAGRVELRVEDEGTGIPAELRQHLFKPGYSGRPGGSGLGLAISQLLARQIGAEITLVESSATGTTFRVWFADPPVAAPRGAG